jgi:twitching motility protein PilT
MAIKYLEALLERMVKEEASDLFLKIGKPPSMRIAGRVTELAQQELSEGIMKEILAEITPERTRKRFDEGNDIDIAYELEGIGRFRASIYRQRGRIGMVFRAIPAKIKTFSELNLPAAQLQKLSLLPRGLVLVTGTAGCGKSTTLASMIDYINHTQSKHIITIEDPIEFTFTDDKSVIDQRELGEDTPSFEAALKHILRQSPDVIMIGEMRDKETMEAALNAAETGHLVLSTLHSVNAMQTVERIINFFPPHQHTFLKMQLSQLLEGVISQRLLTTRDGSYRVPAVELMIATPTIRELLFSGKVKELYKAMKEGTFFGTMTFNQSLKELIDKDLITLEDALATADSPDELKMELRGITRETMRRQRYP